MSNASQRMLNACVFGYAKSVENIQNIMIVRPYFLGFLTCATASDIVTEQPKTRSPVHSFQIWPVASILHLTPPVAILKSK